MYRYRIIANYTNLLDATVSLLRSIFPLSVSNLYIPFKLNEKSEYPTTTLREIFNEKDINLKAQKFPKRIPPHSLTYFQYLQHLKLFNMIEMYGS